ncbi:LpxD N-terminal domain-containing protein, partial [Xanthomonas citri pv. citri]
MAFTLTQILDFLGSDVIDQGDAQTDQNLQKQISKIASLEDATGTDITFIANPLFESKLQTTGAGAVLV